MTTENDKIENSAAVVASAAAEPPGATSLSGVGDVASPAAANQGDTPAVAAESTPKLAESLLEQFDREEKAKVPEPATPSEDAKKDEAKPADSAAKDLAAKPDEAKPGEKQVAPTEPAAPAQVEYAYKLPETIKFGDGDKEKVHAAFDAFRADPAKGAQALVDLHNERMAAYAADTLKRQYDTFNDTRKGWVKEVMADPDIGGSGFRTSMGAIARMRDMFVSPDRKDRFESFLRVTGAGDNPEFLHMLHNVARAFDEPPLPPSISASISTSSSTKDPRKSLRI